MADSQTFQSNRDFTKSVTIAVGQTVSDAIDTSGCNVVGLRTDANLTGTALTFQSGEALAGTYLDFYTNDTATPPVEKEVTLTVSTSKAYGFDENDFSGLQFVKVVADTNQLTNPAVITLVLRPA